MRHLLHISLLLVLLSVAVIGCRPTTSDAERRLIALDSLIATAPDSALTQLAATDTVALSESERAYHALLLAQAMYKAYVPATSDSLISRAWRYYEHSGPYDRCVRARLYQGTVAEELGRPEQAMRWYKQAEDYARPDDHYNRGYALMSQAYLLQREAMSEEVAIDKYRKAIADFNFIADSANVLYSLTQIARLYQIIDLDSADILIYDAMDYALQMGDSVSFIANEVALVNCLFLKNEFENAIRIGNALIASGQMNPNQLSECAYTVCHCYTDLGQADSARRIYSLMPPPLDLVDTIGHLRLQAEIARVDGDIKVYQRLNNSAANKADSLYMASTKSPINNVESQSAVANLQKSLEKSNATSKWILCLLVGLAVVVVILMVLGLRKRNQLQQKFEADFAAIEQNLTLMEQRNRQMEDSSANKQSAYSLQLECLRDLFDQIMHAGPRRSSSLQPQLKKVEITDEQWIRLKTALDILLDGFVSRITDEYGCHENFAKVFCLCYCGASNNMVELCTDLKMQTIANIKQKLAHRVLGEEKTWNDLLEDIKNHHRGIESDF